MNERKEAWMRIVVGIVSGIILYIWFWFIAILFVVNWVYCIFKGKRLKELAGLSEMYNSQLYTFIKYMTFTVNERPFPFRELTKNMSSFK